MLPEKAIDLVAVAAGSEEDGKSIRGGTLQDKKDMWRVGREQELNVCDEATVNWQTH